MKRALLAAIALALPFVTLGQEPSKTLQLTSSTSIAKTAQMLRIHPVGIEINMATGEVKIPEGLKLTDASLAFWKAIADAYPDARKVITEGKGKP